MCLALMNLQSAICPVFGVNHAIKASRNDYYSSWACASDSCIAFQEAALNGRAIMTARLEGMFVAVSAFNCSYQSALLITQLPQEVN